jgi:hypothetical protein
MRFLPHFTATAPPRGWRHRGSGAVREAKRPLPLLALVLLAFATNAGAFEIYAATPANKLVRFDSAAPEATSVVGITGFGAGEIVVGIAFRPFGQQLYALTNGGSGGNSSLYTVDPATGAATLAFPLGAILSGGKFGMRFSPPSDRLRVVSDAGQNLRINPATGALTVDVPLGPGTPHVVAIAYTNAFAGAATTTLYDIDSASDMLLVQDNPNGGTLVAIGDLGFDTVDSAGFDILTLASGDIAYATLRVGGVTGLYTIVLQTGVAGYIGAVSGNPTLIALAIRPDFIFTDGFD